MSSLHRSVAQGPQRDDALRDHSDDTAASDRPDVDRDTTKWCAGKREDPFGLVRHPALREPEHGLLRIPGVENEVDALSTEPAEFRDDAVERSAEGLLIPG